MMNPDGLLAMPARDLLRRHVEAVWDISALAPDGEDITLAEGVTPAWVVYRARLAGGGSVRLWRAGTSPDDRAELANTLDRALDHPDDQILDVRREVVLRQAAEPAISLDEARRVARVLAPEDAGLASAFYVDDPDYLHAPERGPVVGVEVAGRLVTVAHSSRRTSNACELGIDTKPEARRRGYALAATIVWARAVRDEGLIPLYSALASNTASLALAHAAGYREFARAAYFTR